MRNKNPVFVNALWSIYYAASGMTNAHCMRKNACSNSIKMHLHCMRFMTKASRIFALNWFMYRRNGYLCLLIAGIRYCDTVVVTYIMFVIIRKNSSIKTLFCLFETETKQHQYIKNDVEHPKGVSFQICSGRFEMNTIFIRHLTLAWSIPHSTYIACQTALFLSLLSTSCRSFFIAFNENANTHENQQSFRM